jgi:hypothetical protein
MVRKSPLDVVSMAARVASRLTRASRLDFAWLDASRPRRRGGGEKGRTTYEIARLRWFLDGLQD